MAETIDYAHPPRNERHEGHRVLDGADAEETLDACVQLLRDKGVLEVIKSGLGFAGTMMEVITERLEREDVARTIRNVAILTRTLGAIDPDTLENMLRSLSKSTEGSTTRKPPGLLHLLSQLSSGDTRRALEPIAAMLQAVGRSIPRAPKQEHTPAGTGSG